MRGESNKLHYLSKTFLKDEINTKLSNLNILKMNIFLIHQRITKQNVPFEASNNGRM